MKSTLFTLLFVLTLTISGCSSSGGSKTAIQIDSAWVMAGTSGNNTAAFMTLKNTASQDDKLIKAECNISMEVVLMDMKINNDKMEMFNVDSIVVPAKGQVKLNSGSFHVMFMGLNKDLKVGDKIQLTLTFEKAGVVKMDVPVKKPTQ
jgi:periplasmic copper chaperone A